MLQLKELGPLLVEGDAKGNSFFTGVNEEINQRLGSLYEGLKPPVFGRLGEQQKPEIELF